jgi:hypothetical protein
VTKYGQKNAIPKDLRSVAIAYSAEIAFFLLHEECDKIANVSLDDMQTIAGVLQRMVVSRD